MHVDRGFHVKVVGSLYLSRFKLLTIGHGDHARDDCNLFRERSSGLGSKYYALELVVPLCVMSVMAHGFIRGEDVIQ